MTPPEGQPRADRSCARPTGAAEAESVTTRYIAPRAAPGRRAGRAGGRPHLVGHARRLRHGAPSVDTHEFLLTACTPPTPCSVLWTTSHDTAVPTVMRIRRGARAHLRGRATGIGPQTPGPVHGATVARQRQSRYAPRLSRLPVLSRDCGSCPGDPRPDVLVVPAWPPRSNGWSPGDRRWLGMTQRMIRRRRETGMGRQCPGRHCSPGLPDSRTRRLWAAVLTPATAVLSLHTAGRIHGFEEIRSTEVAPTADDVRRHPPEGSWHRQIDTWCPLMSSRSTGIRRDLDAPHR